MTLRGLLVSGDGRLRAPWRIAIFLAFFALATVVIAIVLKSPLDAFEKWTGIKSAGIEVALAMATLAATAAMLRLVDRRPWSYVWMGRAEAGGAVLARGFGLGAAPIAAASLLLLSAHWLEFAPASDGSWWSAAIKASAMLLPAAFFEELLSRGYILAALRDWMGMPAAIALSSVAFGLLHVGNPGSAIQPIIMVTLAGIFLAAVLLATRSLYAATAAHFAWNWVMAVPLHISVSGEALPHPGYQLVDTGPGWATGGEWGPEGGAFAAVTMLAVMGWMYWRAKKGSNSKLQTPNSEP